MRLAETSEARLFEALRADGLGLDLGAARVRIRSDLPSLAPILTTVYGPFEAECVPGIYDVTVDLRRVRGLRRHLRPQVELWIDGATEFERFPLDTPLPLIEWGINYALAARLCCYLLLHAGSVARGDAGLLLPAMPGSGKSTLTAALACHGYRLLSDEFGVLRIDDGALLAMLRPVALKNESIDLIRQRDPSAVLGPSFPGTRKGTVAHLAPRADAVDARHAAVRPRLVVFPQYERDAPTLIEPVPPTRTFARLVANSFNYDTLGPEGYEVLADLVAACPGYELRYGDLDAAIAEIDTLLDVSRAAS